MSVLKFAEYVFERSSAMFRNIETGKRVKGADLTDTLKAYLADSVGKLDNLAIAVADGRITIDEFDDALTAHVSYVNDVAYVLGRGGVNQMKLEDFLELSKIKASELQYVEKFMDDIASGNLSSAQIRQRARLYTNKSYGTMSDGARSALKEAGYTHERRLLNPAEHCEDCIRYDAMGWQPIGTLPRPTEKSECRAHCKCSMEFKRSLSIGRRITEFINSFSS